jgi:glycerol-3-phosphate dehydrogenase
VPAFLPPFAEPDLSESRQGASAGTGFSAAGREAQWNRLGTEPFDLVVVGGGITGAGIAREASGRGLRVALVEAADLGGGTSSRSSRLIHGGLRYLETLEFGLVFEALGERSRLLRLAPHLVEPLSFLFPIYRAGDVGLLKLWAGLWLYDALSLFRGMRSHRMLSRDGVLRRQPGLAKPGLAGGALYPDAQVDDARLTLAVARSAHELGAVVVPYAPVTGFLRDGGDPISGVEVTDARTGRVARVRARLVLSATGPWTDELRRLADPAAVPRLRPTKGVHVQLPGGRLGARGAITFLSPVDGRVMFVLPWGAFTYVGTTDTDYRGDPRAVSATPEDVRYLLDSVNALFPEARVGAEDVVSTWAGVRPLVAPERRDVSESGTSREHEIWREPNGLLCVAGGKLTTFRVMAEEAAERAADLLRSEHSVRSREFSTKDQPLPGAPGEPWDGFIRRVESAASRAGVERGEAARLARRYGHGALGLLARVERQPELARRIVPELPYLEAAVVWAVEEEMATTLEDVLRRRTHVYYEAADGGVRVAAAVARRMAELPGIGWGPGEADAEAERYTRLVQEGRAFRAPAER